MGCFQSNWHLLLLLLCYQTLGILAMGTTTPIELPKMQLIYGLDLQLEYSSRRDKEESSKEDLINSVHSLSKNQKTKKLTELYIPFLCWAIAFFLS
jgi:hypothetical protein